MLVRGYSRLTRSRSLLATCAGLSILASMCPRKLMLALLAVALLGRAPLLRAEDSAGVRLSPATSEEAEENASAPIPISPGARTQREVLRLQADWYQRRLLAPLQAAAQGRPWAAAAQKLAEDSFAVWIGLDQDKTPEAWAALGARGDALIRSGRDDPLIHYLTAHSKYQEFRNRTKSFEEYRRVFDDLAQDSRYPKILSYLVGMNLSAWKSQRTEAFNRELIDLQRESIEEGSYSGADDALFVNSVFSQLNFLEQNLDAEEKVVSGSTKLPEWARETILGRIEIYRASRERGGEFFGEHMSSARAHLEAAWKLRPDQPYAAAEMITLLTDTEPAPNATLRLWFDRAVQAQFDFKKAYTDYTWAIRPGHGGSHEEMLAFGRACAATRRYDTDVPHHLITVLDSIGEELSKQREVFLMPGIAPEVLAMDKGYAAAPALPFPFKHRLLNQILDAWLYQKWDVAREALARLPDRKMNVTMRERLRSFGTTLDDLQSEVSIHTSAAEADYTKARALERQGRYEEAAGRFAAALTACDNQPALRDMISLWLKINETRMELAKGQWNVISPKTADHGDWKLTINADATVPEDGVLQITGRNQSTMTRWNRPVGENYEVRATFEFLAPMDKEHVFAIQLGQSLEAPEKCVTCQFYSNKNTKGTLIVMHSMLPTGNPEFEAPLEKKNHLRVQCWHGLLSIYLNGAPICEKFQSVAGTPSDQYGELGFGASNLKSHEGFRVSKIAVRMLKAEPTPPEDGDDE